MSAWWSHWTLGWWSERNINPQSSTNLCERAGSCLCRKMKMDCLDNKFPGALCLTEYFANLALQVLNIFVLHVLLPCQNMAPALAAMQPESTSIRDSNGKNSRHTQSSWFNLSQRWGESYTSGKPKSLRRTVAYIEIIIMTYCWNLWFIFLLASNMVQQKKNVDKIHNISHVINVTIGSWQESH